MVGQEHIVKTLRNQVKNNKLSHAYLFTGFRGTGKTTCAKILAKAANCPNLKDGNPCNQCDICKGIDNGSVMDILEIDAASNNGVENIRELRDETNFTPTMCKYRVYIIDEVHMLSIGAFNALLKIMEEPPSYVIFILATTEINKVPATILSRCQQFGFNKIDKELISQRLLFVAKSEEIELDEKAAQTIAKFADGGLRDALSVLDACVSLSENNKVDIQIVSKVISVSNTSDLIKIAKHIINKDITSTLEITEKITSTCLDPSKLICQIIDIFKNIMIIKTSGLNQSDSDLAALTDLDSESINQLRLISNNIDVKYIFHILDTLSESHGKILRSSFKQLELELAIIKSIYHDNHDNFDNKNNIITSDEAVLQTKIKNLETEIASLRNLVKKLASDSKLTLYSEINSQKIRDNDTYNNNIYNSKNLGSADISDSSLCEEAKKIENWEEILRVLSRINPGLCAALKDSSGYLNEKAQIVFIKTESSFFLELIRTNQQAKQTLKQAIMQVLGKKYRIGPYKLNKSTNQNQDLLSEDLLSEDLLSEIENLAKQNNLNLDID